MKRLLFIILLGIAAVAVADGPGSRILTTPERPRPAASPALDKDMQRCEEMSGAQKDRCLRALRSATGERPEATGGGTNAGTGASSGTSGASSAVGGAR